MLLDRGALIDLRDMKGETALHYASYKSHKQIVQLLLNRGAKVSCFDARGKTPIDLASDEEVKRLLEEKLKTESNANLRGRRESGPKRKLKFDGLEGNKPEISGAFNEDVEVEEENNNSENGKEENNSGGTQHKKVSGHSNYSADSETGERKSKKTGDNDRDSQRLSHSQRDSDTPQESNSNKSGDSQQGSHLKSETVANKDNDTRNRVSNSHSNGDSDAKVDCAHGDDEQSEDHTGRHKDKQTSKKKKKGGCVIQ